MVPKRALLPLSCVFSFTPGGESIELVAGEHFNQIQRFDLAHERFVSSFDVPFGDRGVACPPQFAPDGQKAIISCVLPLGRGFHTVWDVDPWQLRYRLDGRQEGSLAGQAIWHPSGEWIVTSSYGKVLLWDASTGRKLKSFKPKKQLCSALAFSLDGRSLYLGLENGHFTMLDFETFAEIFTFRVLSFDTGLYVSPDGSVVVVSDGSQATKVLDARSGAALFSLPGGSSSVQMTKDGRWLARGSYRWDGGNPCQSDLQLWDLNAQHCVAIVDSRVPQSGTAICFSPNGLFLAASWRSIVAFTPQGNRWVTSDASAEIWAVEELAGQGISQANCRGKTNVLQSQDIRTGSELMRTEKESPPRRWKGVMPLPQHLRTCVKAIASRSTGKRCACRVLCPCGSRAVALRTTDAFIGEAETRRPATAEIKGKFHFVVHAQCVECGQEHLLFDRRRHGWDAVAASDGIVDQTAVQLAKWFCPSCGEEPHLVSILLVGEGYQDALRESGERLNDENWQEAFGAINFSVECVNCGWKDERWIEYETM